MSNKKTLKILKGALNMELWSITLYEDMISRIEDKKITKALAEIIDDSETHHMAALRKAIHKIKSKIPAKQKLSKERLKELLNKGLKEEIEQQKCYKRYINQISDKEIKRKLKRIFNDEIEHEKKIKKLIKHQP